MQSSHDLFIFYLRSFLLLFGFVAILVNVLVNVRQSSDDACAQGAAVNVHVRAVVPAINPLMAITRSFGMLRHRHSLCYI